MSSGLDVRPITVAPLRLCELHSFDSAETFFALDERLRPCCVVVDLVLDDGCGEQLQIELLARGETIPIMFTAEDCDVESAVRLNRFTAKALCRDCDMSAFVV